MSNPIPFRIVELLTQNFNLEKSATLKEGQNIDVNTQFMFGVSFPLKRVRITGTYTYLSGQNALIKLDVITSFEVEQQAFEGMIKDGVFTLEPEFMQYLATINVGAARGEIHARCELNQSVLASIVLPPINLVATLKDKLEIKVS